MKTTPWFPADVRPVRKGVYECVWGHEEFAACSGGVFFNYWDGKRFMAGNRFVSHAPEGYWVCDARLIKWRGVQK